MKTKKIFLILFILLSIHAFAQPNFFEKREQIKALKVGFITTELELTPEEASRFWPLYNVFDDKQFGLRHQEKKSIKDKLEDDTLDKMSEKEATILLAQIESNEAELYLSRKKFIASLKGIIPSLKIIKLKRAEENFNRKLLQQYRDKGPKK
jgi:hypothetical protein